MESIESLRAENNLLRKKVEYLNKIIAFKDATIEELRATQTQLNPSEELLKLHDVIEEKDDNKHDVTKMEDSYGIREVNDDEEKSPFLNENDVDDDLDEILDDQILFHQNRNSNDMDDYIEDLEDLEEPEIQFANVHTVKSFHNAMSNSDINNTSNPAGRLSISSTTSSHYSDPSLESPSPSPSGFNSITNSITPSIIQPSLLLLPHPNDTNDTLRESDFTGIEANPNNASHIDDINTTLSKDSSSADLHHSENELIFTPLPAEESLLTQTSTNLENHYKAHSPHQRSVTPSSMSSHSNLLTQETALNLRSKNVTPIRSQNQDQNQISSKALNHSHNTSMSSQISNGNGSQFLLNTLSHCVIRIESLIDPQTLSSPPDSSSSTSSSSTNMRRNNYKVSFLVYTDENPACLTPIYRVRKSYIELLIMDKSIRQLLPNLPNLPDFNQIASLNYKNWANSKKVIQNYINHLLSLLKNQKPLNQRNPIWLKFSDYFEFKMDLENLENPEYSVLNLQTKITYLFYIRKNFTMKTYDFVSLKFNNDSSDLIINFILSKSSEVLSKDEVNVSYKNQEIIIKKKKKFSSSKSWIFYAESDYDASELCSRLSAWIGFSTSEADEHDIPDISFEQSEQNDHLDTLSKTSLSDNTTQSSSINAPWKLFKKSAKITQQQLTKSPNLSINPTSPLRGHSNHSSSITSSPNDVLNFKAMPYESNQLQYDSKSSSSSSVLLKSPMKLSNEMFFKPIDDTPKYFKSSLQHSFDLCPKYKLYSHDVPSIVYQCITFLYEQSGEGFEGIFRLNGMMSEVNKIQEIFNENYDCELSKLSPKPDVHSIATLLKRYLRNLEDKLISNEVTVELCQIINKNTTNNNNNNVNNSTNGKAQMISLSSYGVNSFKDVFQSKIPELNKSVLFVLFKYLCDVIKMGKHNKMSVSAMSVLMGPNLSHTDGGGQICIVLLENFDEIFV